MLKEDLKKELRSRLTTSLKTIPALQRDTPGIKELNDQIERKINILDQVDNVKTVMTFEELINFLEEKNGRAVNLHLNSGSMLEFMVDSSQVYIDKALDKFSRKFAQKDESESEPALKHQTGIYLTPPHGRLIWEGKKKVIIKSIELKSHLEEPLYLLSGKYAYGIIKLGKPRLINMTQFKQLAESHRVTEAERLKWWPHKDILYLYPVTFVRRWETPRQWKVQHGAQNFVKDVKFEEYSNSAQFIFLAQDEEKKDDEPKQETLGREIEKYGDWYKIKADPQKTYRYVAQQHIRGDSIHTDFRIEVNDHLIGWTLDTPGSVSKPKHDKFLKPLSPSRGVDYQNLVQRKLIQPKAWLTVKGKIPVGGIGATRFKPAELKIVSSGTVKFGAQKHDFHEYFLKPDKKWAQGNTVAGRWIFAHIPRPAHYERAGEGKMMWAAWKPNSQTPYVEEQDYDESIEKAKKEKGYVIWQHPTKGILKPDIDFRDKKKSWIYK